MNPVSFTAATAADALAQIHEKLGPDAVVVSVRKRPAQGLARLWSSASGIEVIATVPDEPTRDSNPISALAEMECSGNKEDDGRGVLDFGASPNGATHRSSHGWRSVELLERMGLLPLFAERLLDVLLKQHGTLPPATLSEEMKLTRAALNQFWKPVPFQDCSDPGLHVFVGAPGVGKTTVLCKWLTQAVLMAGKSAQVWRLDGAAANTAEALAKSEMEYIKAESYTNAPWSYQLPGTSPPFDATHVMPAGFSAYTLNASATVITGLGSDIQKITVTVTRGSPDNPWTYASCSLTGYKVNR